MNLYRQFVDNTGQSHIEKLGEDYVSVFRQWTAAKEFKFSTYPSGTFLDWHPAEKNMLVAVVSGKLKVTVTDGTSVVCQPGDTRIVSDTVGKGHTGEVIGDEPCVTLMVHIAELPTTNW